MHGCCLVALADLRQPLIYWANRYFLLFQWTPTVKHIPTIFFKVFQYIRYMYVCEDLSWFFIAYFFWNLFLQTDLTSLRIPSCLIFFWILMSICLLVVRSVGLSLFSFFLVYYASLNMYVMQLGFFLMGQKIKIQNVYMYIGYTNIYYECRREDFRLC